MPKLEKKIIIKGKIEALTGLLIGGSGSAMSIGAPDKQVLRNPLTKKPYIPGSSLKGKMRSLIEIRDGHLSKDNGPTNNPDHIAAQLFGYVGNNDNNNQKQPSRLIVRDGELLNGDGFPETDLLFTEAKTENSIDRITAEANPRTFERVPKGAIFNMEMVLNVLDTDKSKDRYLETIFQGLRLIENDYLGGNGSRGNGQVKFFITSVVQRPAEYYKGEGDETPLPIPEDFKEPKKDA